MKKIIEIVFVFFVDVFPTILGLVYYLYFPILHL